MGIAQNYIPCSNQTWQWDILYELEVVIQVSMGYGFDEFSIPPLDGHRLPPKKKQFLTIQHDPPLVPNVWLPIYAILATLQWFFQTSHGWPSFSSLAID